ncbi:hypothetical protein DZF91_38270 [Actinomadura logoneensis]|uniref:Sensor histidine kinase n=1 Tax=Actinomadura logoneensis TaxID=2293572 RepID=A0A372J8S0_9ACTN|nr:hypothetical protein [Actinomadura logoneensis]RFU36395.1 hypothetical protein DZF91_38270 [Actinomadura logoneensis]
MKRRALGDVAVACGLAALPPLAGFQPLDGRAWAVSVAAALPLVVRRRWPVAVFAASDAEASARCRVAVRNRPRTLEIEVRDSGPARGGTSGGFGPVGMRERALAHEGEFDAGPTPDGGFEVRAVLRY